METFYIVVDERATIRFTGSLRECEIMSKQLAANYPGEAFAYYKCVAVGVHRSSNIKPLPLDSAAKVLHFPDRRSLPI